MSTPKRKPRSHEIVDLQREAFTDGIRTAEGYAGTTFDDEWAKATARVKYPYPTGQDKRVVAQAATAVYREVVGTVGTPTGMVSYIEPLVKRHGLEVVMGWWREYLTKVVAEDPKFISARVFASRPDMWGARKAAPTHKLFTREEL